MKRILVVNERLVGGGVENVMKDLILSLPVQEYQVTLMTLHEKRETLTEDYPTHIRYYPLRQAYRSDNFPVRSIRHRFCAVKRRFAQQLVKIWISLCNFDVVIAMEEGSCVKLLSKVRAGRRLAWVHCDFESNHWTKGVFADDAAERDCLALYDTVVCVSNTVAEHLKHTIGDPGNVCVRYNPIDEQGILRKSLQEADIPEAKQKPLFVTVGRLCEAKGYERLQNVCKRLNDEGLDYEVWIIGDGELGEALKAQKEALSLDNVHYLGSQSNPFPYMKRADWILCSSVTEGFSTVLQEATVLGVPILTTRCSGSEELLGDSEFGIVVENDESELYEGMKKVILDPQQQAQYQTMVKKRQGFVNLEKRICAIKELI